MEEQIKTFYETTNPFDPVDFMIFKEEMQDEFKSNIKSIDIWHNKAWVDSEKEVHPEVYNVNITFGDN